MVMYDFIEAVLRRPTMYTITGSLGECICFLKGYISGVCGAISTKEPYPLNDQWHEFQTWLRKDLKLTHDDFSHTFHHFVELHGTSQIAVELMLERYQQYKSSVDETPLARWEKTRP